MKFRTKPVEIEAVQWNGHNTADVAAMAGSSENIGGGDGLSALAIYTPNGLKFASHGDWIVKDPDGGLFPHTPERFEDLYERAEPVLERDFS